MVMLQRAYETRHGPELSMAEEYLPRILSILGGHGDRTYALLFQNNAESRATEGNPGLYNGREAQSLYIAVPMGESRTVSFTSTVPEGGTASIAVRYTPTVTHTPATIDPTPAGMFSVVN